MVFVVKRERGGKGVSRLSKAGWIYLGLTKGHNFQEHIDVMSVVEIPLEVFQGCEGHLARQVACEPGKKWVSGLV